MLLVTLDTLRADRLGCYGRPHAGTPILDALAERGARFADVTAAAPLTLPSHATILTGLAPPHHGVRHNLLYALGERPQTLATLLHHAGFATAAAVGAVVLAPRHGLGRGFDDYLAPAFAPGAETFLFAERPAEAVNRDALSWLDGAGARRFFLWVHYFDAHAPYTPPEPERSNFAGDPYQGEVAHIDRALGQLLAGLESRHLLADTLVVVVSDHGESLGEHGEATHGIFLYQATLRVPFILAGPGVRPGTTLAHPVGLVDVTPTILAGVGVAASGPFDGQSLWPMVQRPATDGPGRTIYAETFMPRYDYGWSELRAVRQGSAKYVLAPRPELYDLATDAEEARNLAAEEPARTAVLAAALRKQMDTLESAPAPATGRVPSPEETAALASLGYLSGAREPRAGAVLPDPKDHIAEAVALAEADALIQDGQAAEAELRLRRLLATDPEFFEARHSLIASLLAQDKATEVESEAQALVARSTGLADGVRLASRAHIVLAVLAQSRGEIDRAVVEYEQALVTPQPADTYLNLARLYLQEGRRAQALAMLRELRQRGDAPAAALALLTTLEPREGQVP